MHLKEVDANLLVTLDALLVDASVTRAAERLGRSASAISHALAKLREIFADELFVRAGQKLVPTAKALELAPTVHVILAGMESLLRPSKPFDPSLALRDFAVAASEAGELILVQPLRQRLRATGAQRARRVDAAASRGEHRRRSAAAAVISSSTSKARRCRHQTSACSSCSTTGSSRLLAPATLSRGEDRSRKCSPTADHIQVNSLPSIELIDRAFAAERLSCSIAARVSSVLVGLLLALNSDALLTLPASLASILEQQFGLIRIYQPFNPIAFPLRLIWHSSYDRDECHEWVRGEFAKLAREIESAT